MIPLQPPGKNLLHGFVKNSEARGQTAHPGCFSRVWNRLVTCFSGERTSLPDPYSTAYAQPRKVSTLPPSGANEDYTGGLEAKYGWGKELEYKDITQALSMLLGINLNEELLESGGEGDVYTGTNKASIRYAIKIMQKQHLIYPKDVKAEFCCLLLAKNPYIATVFALILYNNSNNKYLAMSSLNDIPLEMYAQYRLAAVISEFIPGCTLYEALTTPKGCLGEECTLMSRLRQTCNIGRQLIKALACCHKGNILHRDLKPENIMLLDTDNNDDEPDNPHIKLIDFGFAKNIARLGRTNSTCGSPRYLAPEIVVAAHNEGHPSQNGYGYSVDLWGLGVILTVMLTGRDLESLCHKPEDDEFIKLNQEEGFFKAENYIYTLSFARMDEKEKKKILLDAIPEEGKILPQINTLVNLILDLTCEYPTTRISLDNAGKILDEIMTSMP